MAAEWGVTPWEIEAEASAVWVDRWLLLRNLRAEKQERESKPHNASGRGRKLI